jgi:DNA/RNA endonuclease G (NUC1)
MTKFVLAILSINTLISSAHAAKFTCESNSGFSPYNYSKPADIDHERFMPASIGGQIKRSSSFTAVFDDIDDDNGDGIPDLTGNPTFVTYHLKGLTHEGNRYNEPDISIKRPGDWYKSPMLIELLGQQAGISASRIDNSYDGIGKIWNRGHWAMADHAQRISWEASCDTHNFWNASPQAASLNQGDWLHLETYSAALSNQKGDVWVVTGPIFLKGQPLKYIGDEGEFPIAVPDALFKVLIFSDLGNLRFLPFIYDQKVTMATSGKYAGKPISTGDWIKCSSAKKSNYEYNKDKHLVSLSDIESLTSLKFFPNIEPSLREQLAAYRPSSTINVSDDFWSTKYCTGVVK